MGIWGMGIFANDSALDFLDDVVDDFARRISAALGMEQHDDQVVDVKPLEQVELADLDRIVLPSAAILIRLCTNPATTPGQPADQWFSGGLLERIEAQAAGIRLPDADDPRMPDPVRAWTATPPTANIIRAWRERSLAVFTANVRRHLTSADYREERPAVIKLTFDQLEALAVAVEQ